MFNAELVDDHIGREKKREKEERERHILRCHSLEIVAHISIPRGLFFTIGNRIDEKSTL